MPYFTPIGALDSIERQIRRVRFRRNLHALQRAAYLGLATVAAAATVLVLLALRAGARLFAVASWSVGATILASAILLVVETRRRWLGAGVAPGWIDRRASLRGRLQTLAAIRERPALGSAAFTPLLVEDSLRERTRWTPAALVRRPVPLGALSSAIAATGALLLALAMAPRLQPHVPEIVFSDQPVASDAGERLEGVPDRVIVAPSDEPSRRRDDALGAALEAPGAGDGRDESALARLPTAIQKRIREQLWGEAWTRMRDAMARAERDARTADAGERDGADEIDGGAPADQDADEWEQAPGPATRSARARRRKGGTSAAGDAGPGDGGTRRRGRLAPDDEADDALAAGDPAGGAGGGTDPDLYGAQTGAMPSTSDTFELGIAARVRGRRGGPGPAPGEAPPAPADAHPELAADQRPEAAVHHMVVPAAYESLVREVFAHRDGGSGAAP